MDAHKDIIERPFLAIFKDEWRVWVTGAILSFIAASLFISGWPHGLIPDIQTPFTYAGDGISYLWNIKRVVEETWYFNNTHTGFPFGSNHLDYPTADTGSYFILKVIGLLFQSPVAALNLYYLLGFSACFVASYIVIRTLGVSRALALVGAILYTFASFHFTRIGHLFFTWYFVAPLFFYYGLRLFSSTPLYGFSKDQLKPNIIHTLMLMLLASFGIYYALFGCIVLFVSAHLAAIYQRSWRHLYAGYLAISAVVAGVLINIAPSLLHIALQGQNREGVQRMAAESELYGLKLIQLLLPRGDHRLLSFFEFANKYNSNFPLVTENISASMGLAAVGGFIALVAIIFVAKFLNLGVPEARSTIRANAAEEINNAAYIYKLQVLGLIALSLFLMATVGGFASLFAMTVSTSIRSWNRISIFIEFASITAFVVLIDWLLARFNPFTKTIYKNSLLGLVAVVLLVLGLLDQTTKPCTTCMMANRMLFENDKAFIQSIEKTLPAGVAIYQLPYMAYPEYGAVNGLGSYDQARGHVHSTHLNWSFGGIRGREGDWFYRQLSHLPLAQQVVIVKAMGFAGIYVDKRGYLGDVIPKQCAAYASEIQKAKNDCLTFKEVDSSIGGELGSASVSHQIVSNDKQIVFIPVDIEKTKTDTAKNLTQANWYLKAIGFEITNGIPYYVGSMTDVVDFRKIELPLFVTGTNGLSGLSENTTLPMALGGQASGRWSDANMAPRVTVWLAKPLPEKFTLTLRARAAGPNAGKPLQIKVGPQTKEVIFGADLSSQTIRFEGVQAAQKIEFKPFEPFVPARRWGGDDMRMVGVEFEQLSISPD